MEERTLHLLDYLSILNRRRRWLVAPLALCLVGGAALALLLPTRYLAQAIIGVTTPAVSADLLKGAASSEQDDRGRAIYQQLLSARVLERVAREEALTAEAPVETAVARLRANTMVQPAEPLGKGTRTAVDTFYLQYLDRTPERAQRIADRLARVFVDEHSRQREVRAEHTAEFIAAQLRESQERLTALEAQLRQKKERYMGRLPEQRDANLQIVAGLQRQLESSSNALRGEQDRLTMIERQIEGMKQGAAELALPRSSVGPMAAQGRIVELQRQLAEARGMYTDKHPEIQRLQEELATARADAAAARSQPANDRLALLQADPAYQQLLADRALTRLRVQNLQRAEASARAQIGEYQRRVEAAPMVEQELAALSREYELEKQQYAQLSGKHQAALVAEDLERTQGSERFSVLYPATWPDRPFSPNRGRIMLIALALGMCLGLGGVAAREYLDRSVHDARAIQTEFEVPVLAEIPRIARAS